MRSLSFGIILGGVCLLFLALIASVSESRADDADYQKRLANLKESQTQTQNLLNQLGGFSNSRNLNGSNPEENDAKLAARYGTHYRKAGVYPLRPGVQLVLLVRRDLADADTKSLNSQLIEPPAVEQRPEVAATPASKK